MRIVVDAMGTDKYPMADVGGAVLAAREFGYAITLVGDETLIKDELNKHETTNLAINVVHAEQVITMDDKPSLVGKAKPNSSIHIGMNLVKNGEGDAFITAGNTGAAHAIAMLYTLKRIRQVKRPALSSIFRFHGHPTIFLDIGANTDSKPEWLLQFAMMGGVYSEKVLGRENPRIALLSNGEEENKGSQLILQTAELLKRSSLRYVGNIEPSDIANAQVDVIVSDGFVGNILLKTFEASTQYLATLIRNEIEASVVASLGGLLIRPAMRRVRKEIDTYEIGGAPLLGVNGVVIISHGGSNAIAIKNGIHQAAQAVEGDVISTIRSGMENLRIPEKMSDAN